MLRHSTMANSLLYAIIFLCYIPWEGTAQTPPSCQDTGCTKHFNGEARCVYVREGNWTHIGRQFDITTAKVDGLCRSTPDDCCRCFRLATTTTTTTTTPSPGCTDVDGSCRAEFNGTGACIDVRNGDLSHINIDVKPVDGKCGATAQKCCECFKLKTKGSTSPEHTSLISTTPSTTAITSTIATPTTTSTITTTITSTIIIATTSTTTTTTSSSTTTTNTSTTSTTTTSTKTNTITTTTTTTTTTFMTTTITTTTTTKAIVIDGGWSSWKYDKCSKTCGKGIQKGTRSCNNPTPANGGKNCFGSTTTKRKCITNACPVIDGGWSSWKYDTCSKTCGGGTQKGTRSCNNPTPAYGGKNCVGSTTTTRSCNTDACPGSLFATCDNTMEVFFDGVKYTDDAMKHFTETSQISIPPNTEVIAIFCKDHGGQEGIVASTTTGEVTDSSWKCSSVKRYNWMMPSFDDSSWNAADISRGTNKAPIQINWGLRPNIAHNAYWIWPTGYPTSTTEAYCRKRVGYGGRSDWSYCKSYAPCSLGKGDCDSDNDCSGSLVCGTDNCRDFHAQALSSADCCTDHSPRDGGWSSWSYDTCSKTCGGGTQKGTRLCNNPTPANGGKNCVGATTTTRSCNTDACPSPGFCHASLNWFECQTSYNKCGSGYRDNNYYVSSKAKCCCHCVGSNGNTGIETC